MGEFLSNLGKTKRRLSLMNGSIELRNSSNEARECSILLGFGCHLLIIILFSGLSLMIKLLIMIVA